MIYRKQIFMCPWAAMSPALIFREKRSSTGDWTNPTGQEDAVFLDVIRKIEKNILEIRDK